MNIEITFSEDDVREAKAIAEQMATHRIVEDRLARNVQRGGIDLSHEAIWKALLHCLLTTMRDSSENSRFGRFIQSNSPLLSLSHCEESADVENMVQSELAKHDIKWRATVIAKEVASNVRWLKGSGGWNELDALLSPFRKTIQPKNEERRCALRIAKMFSGFGPKQSRNFLQMLGLTRHEIPIDSRVVKWIKENLGNGNSLCLLSAAALTKDEYYCFVLDAIQELCEKAKVLPCVFDAAVFASLEKP